MLKAILHGVNWAIHFIGALCSFITWDVVKHKTEYLAFPFEFLLSPSAACLAPFLYTWSGYVLGRNVNPWTLEHSCSSAQQRIFTVVQTCLALLAAPAFMWLCGAAGSCLLIWMCSATWMSTAPWLQQWLVLQSSGHAVVSTRVLSPVPAVHGNTTSLVLGLSISWRHFLPAKCLLLPQGTGGRNIIPLLGCESCCFRSISSRSGSAAKLRQWAAVGDFHILFKNCDVEIASIVKCYDSSIWWRKWIKASLAQRHFIYLHVFHSELPLAWITLIEYNFTRGSVCV